MKPETTVDAKKNRFSSNEALEMASKSDQLYVAKGTKVVHFDLKKDKPDKETILSHIMGPSGNLRAPTMRVGKTMIVGFNADMYAKVFG